MSSYIIAGSADSIDTAYCEQIARRINSKYKNIDFRVVIKHPSEWEQYLQEICRIYGFLKKSNPIIYTFDGKIIGSRENFVQTATKYFGLDQQNLIVENLTSKVNMKLAQEEITSKNIIKNNIKTLTEKIEDKYKDLLAKKILKLNLKQKERYLVNGIQYIHRQLDVVAPMYFTKQLNIPLVNEEVVAEDINLLALSLNDQIKPQETLTKQAFMTANNEKQKHAPSEQDRMSEASKTNKMHESILSYDKDSKGVKQSNRTKLRIDEQNDDVPDYIDYPLKDTVVCGLGDQFCIAFDPKSPIGQELIFYFNEDPNGNILRIHNDGRPIKGHRVLIKQVHYVNQNLIEQSVVKNQVSENGDLQESGENENLEVEAQIQKSKTQPNIPVAESQGHILNANTNKVIQQDAISEANSNLNLTSHLNYHTLYIHKPLSILELKNLIYFIKETNTIGCLQFLPQNPNPRMRVYIRRHLVPQDTTLSLPVQRFIQKQLQEKQFSDISIPTQKGVLAEQNGEAYKLKIINGMGYTHYIYQLSNDGEEKVHRVIKHAIDHILALQEQFKQDIGYNLIFTKEYLIFVPLVEPYDVYNKSKLYLDGLAFLGYIHTARLQKPFEITKPKVGTEDKGYELRALLRVSTGMKDEQ